MKNTTFPSHSTSGLIGVPTMDYDNPKKKIGSTIPYKKPFNKGIFNGSDDEWNPLNQL